ncbi:MAG: hypothetical protein ABW088_03930 [Sedimenticola sp.]
MRCGTETEMETTAGNRSNKRHPATLAGPVFALLITLMPQVVSASVAMIVDLVGTTTLERNGQQQPANLLDYLQTGDKLTLAKQSGLTLVYLKSAREYRYQGQARLSIGPESPQQELGAPAQSRELSIMRETGLSQQQLQGYEQAGLVMRSIKPRKTTTRVSITQTWPVVRWRDAHAAQRYQLLLNDLTGNILHRAEVDGTVYNPPGELQLIRGKRYYWIVRSLQQPGEPRIGRAGFHLPAGQELEDLRARRPAKNAQFSDWVIYAVALERAGLSRDAREVWQWLAGQRPDDKALAERAAD